jgi:hypothetical protein
LGRRRASIPSIETEEKQSLRRNASTLYNGGRLKRKLPFLCNATPTHNPPSVDLQQDGIFSGGGLRVIQKRYLVFNIVISIGESFEMDAVKISALEPRCMHGQS